MIRAAWAVRLARMSLSERERAILDCERSWWQQDGPKEAVIREQLGLSPTGYYRILGTLVDSPEARAYDPLVVLRLRRDRARRRRERFQGASSDGPRSR